MTQKKNLATVFLEYIGKQSLSFSLLSSDATFNLCEQPLFF